MSASSGRGFRSAIALATLALSTTASAASTQQNLAKYQRLRDRLLTEFTVVGESPGDSQPADLRDDGEGFIKWADSTIRLGWYLSVLATEYHLVTHLDLYPGAKGKHDTLSELYKALLAMERLDEVADASFPPPCTSEPKLNGFFIRDDVPDGYSQKLGLPTTQSDFVDPELTNKEMSQDQVYHVLMGLAAVKRFVPTGVTIQGRDLRSWAVEQATRIGEHISKDGWTIRNPACGNRAVNRGPNAGGFSGGTRLALGFITDGAFIPETKDILIDIWQDAKQPGFVAYIDVDSLHMASAIAAVGDGWGEETSEGLAAIGEKPDWPLYVLMHRALHDEAAVGWCKTGAEASARARAMLDELPDDGEPASPKPAALAPHGFTRSNRFMRGKETAYTGEEFSEGYRFNGLDYLLLHNVYAIANPATWEGGSGPGIPECTTATPASESEEESGCGCRTPSQGHGRGSAAALLALALYGLRRSLTGSPCRRA